MATFEIFLIPGDFFIALILRFFQLPTNEFEPLFLTIFAGFISWIFWMAVIRAVWAVTLKLFGFGPRRPY